MKLSEIKHISVGKLKKKLRQQPVALTALARLVGKEFRLAVHYFFT